jgi:hypothetical protein
VLEGRGFDEDALDQVGADEDDVDDEFGEPSGKPFPEDDDEWFAARFPRLWAKHRAA